MGNQWLDVSAASEKVQIPSETVRRYIREHGVHLRVKKDGKYYYVHEESLNTIKQIRHLYSEGKKKNEIEDTLSASGIPMTITVTENSEQMTVNVAEKLINMERAMNQKQQLLMGMMNELAKNRETAGALSSIHKQMNETLTAFQQIAVTSEAQRREDRFIETNARIKIEGQLRQEALQLWMEKPHDERMMKAGFLRREENISKRDLFIQTYMNEHLDERFKQMFDLK